VRRRNRRAERIGGEIADIMIGQTITPGPAAGQVEQRETLAIEEFARLFGIGRRRATQHGGGQDAAHHHRRRIMRCEILARDRDVGKVGTDRDHARIIALRGACEPEAVAARARNAGAPHPHAIGR
jgi:hypothetical protein